MTRSGIGFVLLDAALRPLYQNEDALRILGWPENFEPPGSSPDSAARRLRTVLGDALPNGAALTHEVVSGRRRYLLRAFRLHAASREPGEPAYGVLLERSIAGPLAGADIAARFHLTQRELQTVELLVLGLTSKDIAARMQVSPNTVKAFLRTVMAKMQTSTRTGVIGRVLEMKQRPPSFALPNRAH